MEQIVNNLKNMIEEVIEQETKLDVVLKQGTSRFSNTIVPYEYSLENCIYIEGDYAILHVENVDGMEISYDELEDEYRITIGETTILICRI